MDDKLNNKGFPVTVYLEDTDAGGRVYYANYLKYAERARVNFFKSLGFNHHEVLNAGEIMFVVRSCSIDYAKAAFLGDELHVITSIDTIGGASITLTQKVFRQNDLIAMLTVKLALIYQNGQIAKLDQSLVEKLQSGWNLN